jgi:outer membrane protein TolC
MCRCRFDPLILRLPLLLASLLISLGTTGCRSPAGHLAKADRDAQARIAAQQEDLFGTSEPLQIETAGDTLRRRLLREQQLPHSGNAALGIDQLTPPPGWPGGDSSTNQAATAEALPRPLPLSLTEALQIGAAHSRAYQAQKEAVYTAALNIDVADAAFRSTLEGAWTGGYEENRGTAPATRGLTQRAALGLNRTLQIGASLSSQLAIDLVKLLTLDRSSAYGLAADLSVSIPLLRGAGRRVVTEPLTQAERNLMYAMLEFERFKQSYAVNVARDYFRVLQLRDQVTNASNNFERIRLSTDRARRLAEAGRLQEIQVDQSQQEEWRARERWLSARVDYERQRDAFNITLGLPADAQVQLDDAALTQLRPPVPAPDALREPIDTSEDALQLPDPDLAIPYALQRRHDLLIALGQVEDAQRRVVVAADALQLGLTLTGNVQAGGGRSLSSAGEGDVPLRFDEGQARAALELDLPWQKADERAAYRRAYLDLEAAIRNVQGLEDEIKSEVRQAFRVLDRAAESRLIQARSVALAQRRVESTELFLQAGRAQIRDILEAQEALISAQNGLTAAAITYRLAQLELQRDLAILTVTAEGLPADVPPLELETTP